jgi:hypothetical protein
LFRSWFQLMQDSSASQEPPTNLLSLDISLDKWSW